LYIVLIVVPNASSSSRFMTLGTPQPWFSGKSASETSCDQIPWRLP
jgi:hypothetical protein